LKLAKLIYNPVAGDATFKTKLDLICEKMQEFGWQVVPYCTKDGGDFKKGLADLAELDYQAIFAAGGDGTIHQVINELMAKSGPAAPKAMPALGVYPAGTANDLAVHLGMPREIEAWCQVIGIGKTELIDLGKANHCYFHNVASAGLLTEVSQEVNYQLKNILGKIAYYLKGVEKLPKFKPFSVTLTVDGKVMREKILLLLVLNGKSAGGFTQLAPRAELTDGKLEVILVKDCSLRQMLALFISLIQGEHLSSPKVEYFQARHLVLDCGEKMTTDLDGEKGPGCPLEISVCRQVLPVFICQKTK
jgi:YegS/Rv2252/BmrU family lipid kinase